MHERPAHRRDEGQREAVTQAEEATALFSSSRSATDDITVKIANSDREVGLNHRATSVATRR